MSALAGFIKSHASPEDASSLERMLGTLMHESNYRSASAAWPEMKAGAGWVSTDGWGAGCEWNEARNIALILRGEVFADADVTGTGDVHASSRSLIAFYEKHGLSFLEELNGWFNGLLVDLRKRQIVLFNDRYGLGRIYYHEASDGFYFTSEAKAILKLFPNTRQLDEKGLAEWLTCGCVLQNRSLFKDLLLLPPGSAWVFSVDGKVTKSRYFDPASWETQPPLSAQDYYESLKQTFPRILKRYFNGSRPVAMSLTGGLDGRMIMSWSPRKAGELPCYTFNGPIRDCADVKIARKVARACSQEHQSIQVEEEFFRQFLPLAEKAVYLTDGAMDVTGAVELYVNRLAQKIAPVRLTGNYGSEILRRHVAFRPRTLSEGLFTSRMMQSASDAAKTYGEEAAGNRLAFVAFKQVPWHHYARFAIEQSQITIRSPFLDNELVGVAFRSPAESATSLEPSLRLIAEGNAELGRIPTDRGVTYPAGKSMNRLHRSMQEFLAKAEYAYDYGMPDWLARADKCVAPLQLERLFLGRQKFCHFRSWYRHQLAGDVKQVLLDPRARSREYLNGAALEALVSAHVSGTRNATVEIHKLLSLELLQRQLLS